jgi:hypothetical protein
MNSEDSLRWIKKGAVYMGIIWGISILITTIVGISLLVTIPQAINAFSGDLDVIPGIILGVVLIVSILIGGMVLEWVSKNVGNKDSKYLPAGGIEKTIGKKVKRR